ncbi:MAG: U32 family peptidase [Desulfitobacterium sp.]|nr:U32 family peptidase [Desulfitobacterium sp.]
MAKYQDKEQNKTIGTMELLAPAGSFEAFKAAVENGADAVYLGGKSFNARANAANFDLEELRKVVQYAHEREVKVYVTVNILIADKEFPELCDYLYELYEIGVDALILQDIGVASFIQKVLPELERHGSTQMTINNSWGMSLGERLGFQRVVLAREVNAQEMKEISANSSLDIEVFVHGALCICYSGQCLMSSYIGGRSGNRGCCAQPCRLPYQLVNHEGVDLLAKANVGNYLLSPRDLNFVEELRHLQECGVNSLKVEGRMKRPEYVATVIGVYRKALDHILRKEKSKKSCEQKETLNSKGLNSKELNSTGISDEERRDLLQIFNRGFSQAYFHGHPGAELMSYERPNNRGVVLGKVTNNISKRLEIKLETFLRPGDGLEIWTRKGREGITVDRIWLGKKEVREGKPGDIVQIYFSGKVKPGVQIYKTYDYLLMEKARVSFQEGKEQRKRPLRMRLSGSIGEKLTLEAWDRENVAKIQSQTFSQKAIKRPLTNEVAYKQLSRLGNTPFWLENLVLDVEEELMIPVSELNEMRRQVVEELLSLKVKNISVSPDEYQERLRIWSEELAQKREEAHREELTRYNKETSDKEGTDELLELAAKRITVAVSNLEGVQAALKSGAKRIAFGGERWRSRKGFSLQDVEKAIGLCLEKGAEPIWRLPRVLNESQSKWWFETLKKAQGWEQPPKMMVSNLGEIEMIKALDPTWPFEVDYTLNVFNESALAYFLELGAQGITLSTELERSQVEVLAQWGKTEVMVFGDLEMMVSEYCPIGATLGGKKEEYCSAPCVKGSHYLKDRLKYQFPIETDLECRMHLFNSRVLNLYQDLGTLEKMGVNRIRLQLDRANPMQIENTFKVFLNRWKDALQESRQENEDNKVKGYLEELYPEGFTKGHFSRGVL